MSAPTVENFEMTIALADLSDWLIQQGLEDASVDEWVDLFCHKIVDAGIPITRVNIAMRAHHPEIGSVAFRWHRDSGKERFDYSRQTETPQDYLSSPIYHILNNDIREMHERLAAPTQNFPIFDELRAQGATDYYLTKRAFQRNGTVKPGEPHDKIEGFVVSIVGDRPGGFTASQMDGLRSLISPLALTLKCTANRLMAEDITAAYLGADASRRVLSGAIQRGTSETISAVICAFDLQGFTRLSEHLPGTAIIEMLNDYFAESVDIIEESGGNVLKFMGDGLLAIYDLDAMPDARHRAVQSAVALREKFVEMNTRRTGQGVPVTGFKLALHAGDVLYGNIGGKTRLDFTVIGPAVNTTARILGMCDAVDQTIVISQNVAKDVMPSRSDIVSLGQYRLRGVTDRHELFTLD